MSKKYHRKNIHRILSVKMRLGEIIEFVNMKLLSKLHGASGYRNKKTI
jgi:hypothetical protein